MEIIYKEIKTVDRVAKKVVQMFTDLNKSMEMEEVQSIINAKIDTDCNGFVTEANVMRAANSQCPGHIYVFNFYSRIFANDGKATAGYLMMQKCVSIVKEKYNKNIGIVRMPIEDNKMILPIFQGYELHIIEAIVTDDIENFKLLAEEWFAGHTIEIKGSTLQD